MTSLRLPRLAPVTTFATLATLAACGGGGGSAAAGSGQAPASGAYAWVLKAQGPTSALSYGLSFVHAGAPGTEFVVESGSSVLTDTRVVSTGAVDAVAQKTGTLAPWALVYVIGGDVRRVPLQADGDLPATQVQRAHSNNACRFLVDADQHPVGDAVDYATPAHSRLLVSTAGADGQCGTGDDGTAEVRLDDAGGLSVTPISGAAPLGSFRDAATLAPRGWVFPRTVVYWTSGAGASVVTRTDADPAFTKLVVGAPLAALMDDGVRLSVLDLSSATTPAETRLDDATTGGGGWVGIGFDANAYYAYQNTGSGATAAWKIVKVSRSAPHATLLATSGGQVSVASMGDGLLYATVLGDGGNSLVAVSKSAGVPALTLESTPPSTLTTVQTSAAGVHELWRIVNIGTAALNYAIEFIDESGTRLYTTNAGGFPMTAPDATVERFDTSESRTRFVFANGYGARAFGDATLMGYDAASRSTVTFGTLPGTAAFGTATVYASAIGGPGGLMAGFAASTVDGVIQPGGAEVFSFDFERAQSFAATTAVR